MNICHTQKIEVLNVWHSPVTLLDPQLRKQRNIKVTFFWQLLGLGFRKVLNIQNFEGFEDIRMNWWFFGRHTNDFFARHTNDLGDFFLEDIPMNWGSQNMRMNLMIFFFEDIRPWVSETSNFTNHKIYWNVASKQNNLLTFLL